jgi:hypothetical protein
MTLRYPLVLIHGLGAKSTVGPFDYYHVLIPLLKKAKTPYFVADLTSFQTVEHRSRELYAQILRQFPDLGKDLRRRSTCLPIAWEDLMLDMLFHTWGLALIESQASLRSGLLIGAPTLAI